MIGVIIPTVDNTFFSSLAHSIEKEMSKRGYKTVICDCDNNAEKEKEYLKVLDDLNVRGIIDVSGLSELPEGIIREELINIANPTSYQDKASAEYAVHQVLAYQSK